MKKKERERQKKLMQSEIASFKMLWWSFSSDLYVYDWGRMVGVRGKIFVLKMIKVRGR